jgi:hypothetical protein
MAFGMRQICETACQITASTFVGRLAVGQAAIIDGAMGQRRADGWVWRTVCISDFTSLYMLGAYLVYARWGQILTVATARLKP